MAKLLKLRRGTTTQHGSFTGAEGELTIDTTKDTAVVHDGSQAGGRPLLREDMSNLPAGTIDNADVNASAAIDGTKISPDFGSQDITTTGKIKFANVYSAEGDLPSASTYHGMFAHVHSTGLAYYAHGGSWHKLAKLDAPNFTGGIDVTGNIESTGNLEITNTLPKISLIDSDNNDDFDIKNHNGNFIIADVTDTTDRLVIDSNGTVSVGGNLDVGNGIDVLDGNITLASGHTVDGRDVSTDGSKLDGIESGATADQSASEIVSLINGQSITPAHVHVGTSQIGSDSNDYIAFSNNAYMNVVINGNNEFRFEADGDFHADGDVIAQSTTISSDRKLKENIEVIPNALDKVQALNGVSFDWKKTGEKSAGVIAQEVQEVLPEAVKEVTPLKGGDSHLSVNYHALTSILIEAIKELQAEVEKLKGGK